MKRSELIFNVISVPADLLMILLAASVAYFLRYEVETLPVLFDLTFNQYLQLILLPALLLLFIFAFNGLYTQKSTRGVWNEIGRVVSAVSAGFMLVVILFFFNRNLFPSRLIILMAWVFIIIAVSFGRIMLLYLQRRLLKKGMGLHRLLVMTGREQPKIIEEIKHNRRLGYELVNLMQFSRDALAEIEAEHRRDRIDELLLTDPSLSSEDTLDLIEFCEQLGIKFSYLPSHLEAHKAKIESDVIGSVPVLRLTPTPLQGWGSVVKRILDIAISATALLVLSPLLLLVVLLIKLDSRGPIFFHQRRGSSFHNFEFYKFRTMHHNLSEGTPQGDRVRAELEKQNVRGGPYVKIKNDPRVTRVGKVLRKTKLDELPQLWHVLRGQMSLVGPRIHMLKEVEKFEDHHKKLFTNVKPGATGLAQINQVYNPELQFDEEVRLDLFYIENWSIRLDFYIIAKTIILLLTKRTNEDY